jgi:hypothetical protein
MSLFTSAIDVFYTATAQLWIFCVRAHIFTVVPTTHTLGMLRYRNAH